MIFSKKKINVTLSLTFRTKKSCNWDPSLYQNCVSGLQQENLEIERDFFYLDRGNIYSARELHLRSIYLRVYDL